MLLRLLLTLALAAALASAQSRSRVIVLTDIENEPDDAESLVRFLTYSNLFDIEGLIATSSVHLRNRTAPHKIRDIVEAYGQVQPNLLLHEPGFPKAGDLLALVRSGPPEVGMAAVGPQLSSPGAELLLLAAARPDPRPLWILVWGGPNTLAQALFQARATLAPAQLAQLVAKLRVYTISDQDDSGPWLRKSFPSLFYITSPGLGSLGAYHHSTWSGISGDHFSGRFTGADFSLVDKPWLESNIRAKGPLGAQYPEPKFLMEGDTPSFLYLIPNGLGDPEHPNWGSWGGRYESYTPPTRKWFLEPETRPLWTDAEDEVLGADNLWHQSNKASIWRWRSAYQNDFAARMDWTVLPRNQANHPPVPQLAHPAELSARSGERVTLSAAGSSDPDNHPLSYLWLYYGEPSTLALSNSRTGAPLPLDNANSPTASFLAPKVAKPETLHFILAVTDRGRPPLTRYRRVLVNVFP